MKQQWLTSMTVAGLCLACGATKTPTGPAPDAVPAGLISVEPLRADLPAGLSGLTWTPDARLLAVSERVREAVVLDPTRRRPSARLPISGVPEGLDLESVAVFGDGRVVMGTDGYAPTRTTDMVLVGELGEEGISVEQLIELSWRPFGLTPEPNHGIEALCVVGDQLVAVGEETGRVDKRRFAPAWIRPLGGGAVLTAQLLLSSETGKVSGLACRRDAAGALAVTGIERHYGVIRIVEWTLADGWSGPIEPNRVVDISPALGPNPPNPEGLALDPASGMWLVSDNDYGGVSGPAKLIRIAPH